MCIRTKCGKITAQKKETSLFLPNRWAVESLTLYSDYSEVVTVGAGADAVDFKLVSLCHKGDIVVTQDYGVAAMILGKGAYGIHQNGKWYTNENIDRMLMERHLAKKARNAKKKHHLKGPSKRTDEDDRRFAESFTRLVEKRLKTEDEA